MRIHANLTTNTMSVSELHRLGDRFVGIVSSCSSGDGPSLVDGTRSAAAL